MGRRVEVMTTTQYYDAPSVPGIHRLPQPPRTRIGRLFRKALWIAAIPLRTYDYGIMWLLHSRSYARRLASELGDCVVLSTFPPLCSHLTALAVKNRSKDRKRVTWIADFRDPMIGNPFRGFNAVTRMLDRRLERVIIRKADAVLVNTDSLAGELRQRYPEQAGKISVLWNGYDPAEQFGPLPIPPRDFRALAHVGTMYGGRHPAILIDSFDRLRLQGCPSLDKIRLVQIGPADLGDMPNRERFLEMVREGRVEMGGERVPRADAMRAIAEADLLLLLDLNIADESTQVPAKIFDYVRAGRPILLFTNRNSPSSEIIAKCGVPHRIVYRDDSADRIDAQVREFLSLPSDAVAASPWFLERFDGARQAQELGRLIGTL